MKLVQRPYRFDSTFLVFTSFSLFYIHCTSASGTFIFTRSIFTVVFYLSILCHHNSLLINITNQSIYLLVIVTATLLYWITILSLYIVVKISIQQVATLLLEHEIIAREFFIALMNLEFNQIFSNSLYLLAINLT